MINLYIFYSESRSIQIKNAPAAKIEFKEK